MVVHQFVNWCNAWANNYLEDQIQFELYHMIFSFLKKCLHLSTNREGSGLTRNKIGRLVCFLKIM